MSEPGEVTNGKPWYTSKTIWGGLIAAVSPVLALALHKEVTPDMANALASLAAAIGGVIAVYGRFKAEQPIAGKK